MDIMKTLLVCFKIKAYKINDSYRTCHRIPKVQQQTKYKQYTIT